MKHFNILTRRDFFSYASKVGVAAAFSSLIDIPLVAKRALAADTNGTLVVTAKNCSLSFFAAPMIR